MKSDMDFLIAGYYLHRLRIWDREGRQMVAMRVWSDTPFEPGMLMQMQPTVAPRSNITPAMALAALEAEIEEREEEETPCP